ncbi:MAG: hypothetical protein CMC15_15295 [Flavobacteriaceae bacterium]|nr:hypothetical protein [Flavobacteriaceae bacterium]
MSDIAGVNFEQIIEDGLNTLRVSIDGTKTILKYSSETKPDFLQGITDYNLSEILEIINDPENGWIINDN